MFLWLLKAAKKELTLPPSLSADQLREYTGYSQPEAPSLFGCGSARDRDADPDCDPDPTPTLTLTAGMT